MVISGAVSSPSEGGSTPVYAAGGQSNASATAPGAVDLERPFIEARQELLDRFERSYLSAQLERHGGNISRAARAAGLDRMHFKRLLARHQHD